MERAQRSIKLRLTRRGNIAKRSIEHYLRTDIPCVFSDCPECSIVPNNTINSENSNVFIIASENILTNYIEIVENLNCLNFVVLTSVYDKFKEKCTSRNLTTLKKLMRDKGRFLALFDDKFSRDIFNKSRKLSLGKDCPYSSLAYASAIWLSYHRPNYKFYTLTDIVGEHSEFHSSSATDKYSSLTISDLLNNDGEVLENSLKASLTGFQTNTEVETQIKNTIEKVKLLYESILDSEKNESSDEFNGTYDEFLSATEIEKRLANNELMRGTVKFPKHNTRKAFVNCKVNDKEYMKVAVVGRKNINRVIDSDDVVVQVFNKDEIEQIGDCDIEEKEGNESFDPEVDILKEEKASEIIGRIVGVVQRNWRPYAATIQQSEETEHKRGGEFVMCVPFDSRLPKIRVFTRNAERYRESRLKVLLDSWETNSAYPKGHIVEEIGPIGDVETETKVILLENMVENSPFGKNLEKCLPDGWVIPQSEIKERDDIRESRLVFSIDPLGCQDIDDSLSVHQIENNIYEVGVHIADVSYFVKENSPVDYEARQRGTSVYLTDRRIDMIPKRLSTEECSLHEGKDRLTISVFWEVEISKNSEGKSVVRVQKIFFKRTVIRSKFAFTYFEANEILTKESKQDFDSNIRSLVQKEDIEKLPENEKQFFSNEAKKQILERVNRMSQQDFNSVRRSVLVLNELAIFLRSQREEWGAVSFNDDWKLNGQSCDSNPKKLTKLVERMSLGVKMEDAEEIIPTPMILMNSHFIIEEMMVFANQTVASHIASAMPRFALLRRHKSPLVSLAKELNEKLEKMGSKVLNLESSESIALSMQNILNEKGDYNEALKMLLKTIMSEAEYFCTGDEQVFDFSHFGLAIERYTHFTSPIRRYSDIIVHRQLIACFGTYKHYNGSTKDLTELSHHLNLKNRNSRNAQRMSSEYQITCELSKCFYYSAAQIIAVRDNGVIVFVPSITFGDIDDIEENDKKFFKGIVVLKNRDGKYRPPFNTNVDEEDLEYESTLEQKSGTEILFKVDALNLTKTLRVNDQIVIQIGINHKSKNIYRFPQVQVRIEFDKTPEYILKNGKMIKVKRTDISCTVEDE